MENNMKNSAYHEYVEMHIETGSIFNRTGSSAWLMLLQEYESFPSTTCNI